MSFEDKIKTKVKSTTMQWLGHGFSLHFLFWLTLYVTLILIGDAHLGIGLTLVYEFINVMFYAVLVYFNIFFLVPNYLNDRLIWIFILLIIGASLVITPLKVTFFYFFFNGYPDVQQQLVINKNWYFLASLLFAGASTIFAIVNDWFRQQKEREELKNQTMQSELNFLKSQINPHFLFNTLNSLYAHTLKKSDEAPEIVLKLSEMMRYMLYECNEKEVFLRKEVQYLGNYLELEKLRQTKNTKLNFKVNGDVSDQKIVPLLFIPYIENSFKHGINNSISDSYVDIQLNIEAHNIQLVVENSKTDVVAQSISGRKSGGIGLINARRRLDLLYPNAHELNIFETPNTYKIVLNLKI
jgi:two-component system, LytTR family, sensor kinase